VLVSGSVDEAQREAAKAVGIAGILAKPFTTQELTDTIAQLSLHVRES
jgi:CheY-like chemotaxis protein